MFRTGTPDPWSWSADLNAALNFCVWVLLVDGLHAPPFDRHPAGDGRLRAAGLDPAGWRAWLEAVLNAQAQLTTATPWPPSPDLVHRALDAPGLWIGTPAVGGALRALWTPYQVHWNAWHGRVAPDRANPLPPTLGGRDGRALWRALAPYRDRLPTLRVYLTEYPWLVAALVPPVAVVIGTKRGTLTATHYAAIVEHAAAALAAAV